ncbi:acyl-CoA dehydrogenase family protein [Aquabacterium sp. OR-4]|uniref:acyl-CoA dehydrogenase family protein n=1 Tax=Aquabacterium sp. OR-4 TaxID=2978127 RepID=UPI0021B20D6D|nr:acyl-CoA dehydrogenase family protein [Aquabacterium sp. OR-4]MDT7838547.1 acyl-CoA dehydrogenase family protein [Aquabacterium sp. OR-4]
MNFDDTLDEAAFRAEARAWIAANAPQHLRPQLELAGFGQPALQQGDVIAESRAWQRRKAEAGWACLHWPRERGGRGATPIQRVIWQQEEGVYAKLAGIFIIGQGMIGPTLMAHAEPVHQQRYLPPMASGAEIWCQLFSEPVAGSDLAGLRTRAERDGDGWLINGQKIWTSGAHYSDYGMVIVRTDASVAKHDGLTMFFVDMKSPGIEVRPIKQVNGQSGFNEVFFTNVRVPDHQRLGAVGQGWRVSLTTLMNERLSIGAGMPTGFAELFDWCCEFDTGDGGLAVDDPAVRSRLAHWAVRTSGLKYTAWRSISALSKGQEPGPENSIGKLVAGSMLQEIALFALDLQGPAGMLAGADQPQAAARFQAMLLRSPATRIEGGTDEILRNIIGERVLGLPADLRADRGLPFNQIPTATTARPR